MKKLFLLSLLLSIISWPVCAQTEYGLKFSSLVSDNMTLENAIRLGLENNSDFLTAQQEIIIAEQKVNEAKFRYLPQFALQGTATWFDLDYPMVLPDEVASRFIPGKMLNDDERFFGVGITATQYLYAGGRINGTLKLARANLKQIQTRYETVKNQVVLNIKRAFTQLLYAKANTELAEKIYNQAAAWYRKNGDLWTQIQNKSLLAQLENAKDEAKRLEEKARMEMLVSLNKELNSPLSISGTLEPVSISGDLAHYNLWATEFRPELKSAIYALELDNISIGLALSKRYPDIILNASYEKLGTQNLDDENKQISLAIRLPLPYNFSSQITQKKAEQRKSELKRARMEDVIRTQVSISYNNMLFWQQEALKRQQTYQELSSLFEKANRNASKAGTAPLQAALSFLHTAQDYFVALKENHIAKAELEWAIGKDVE